MVRRFDQHEIVVIRDMLKKGTKISEICRTLGMKKSTFYYHIKGMPEYEDRKKYKIMREIDQKLNGMQLDLFKPEQRNDESLEKRVSNLEMQVTILVEEINKLRGTDA